MYYILCKLKCIVLKKWIKGLVGSLCIYLFLTANPVCCNRGWKRLKRKKVMQITDNREREKKRKAK